jgi:hypothetical protein
MESREHKPVQRPLSVHRCTCSRSCCRRFPSTQLQERDQSIDLVRLAINVATTLDSTTALHMSAAETQGHHAAESLKLVVVDTVDATPLHLLTPLN